MKLLIISIVLLILFSISLISAGIPARAQEMDEARTVARANTEFAFDLYKNLMAAKGNLFFSPYSISTALAMTYAGAKEETEKQMERTLHFPYEQDRLHPAFKALTDRLNEVQKKGNIELKVANSLWPQKDYELLEAFKSSLEAHYGVTIEPLDYQKAPEPSCKRINDWVEGETNHKIKELIKPRMIDNSTTLVLTNAIYFKGNWASQFDKSKTKEGMFLTPEKKEVRTPMMNQKGKFRYNETEDGLKILVLPYMDEDLSMIILLPKKGEPLSELEKRLTPGNLEKWIPRRFKTSEVLVSVPKFKMTSEFELANTLSSMGMEDAFINGKADFSGISGGKDLSIGAVIHKAFVDVNEEGSEAAAATAVVVTRGMPRPPEEFIADHPFIFMIQDNRTGSILFIGRVADPTS